ncbi:serine hydrolase [[Phormidium] sp. ETS-05]|uniref:serine hydrolase n=1 Tax=[Phormidium] sp. ETS-05 TaxID=222819 RepID=UPI001E48359C|nr:serine hydrolase [[Phormidium] sp. ETS-05]
MPSEQSENEPQPMRVRRRRLTPKDTQDSGEQPGMSQKRQKGDRRPPKPQKSNPDKQQTRQRKTVNSGAKSSPDLRLLKKPGETPPVGARNAVSLPPAVSPTAATRTNRGRKGVENIPSPRAGGTPQNGMGAGRESRGSEPIAVPDEQPPTAPTGKTKARQRKKSTSRPSRAVSPILYTARLAILGVGLGAIVGTMLSVWNPAKYKGEPIPTASSSNAQMQPGAPGQKSLPPGGLALAQELTDLKTQLQTLATKRPELIPGLFVLDIDNNSYVDLNGSSSFAAASTIKLPILIAFFQDVDAGKIRLDEMLTMEAKQVAEGSGDMQYQPPGTKWTALDTATNMIIISDNTATNMIIDRLGGIEALNDRFQSWGLTSTVIRNPLPDLEGTNTTSPKDLVQVMAMVNQGDLLSLRSRDRAFSIMRDTRNNSLLPQGLGEGAVIAHKTGDIGSAIGDAGMVDMKSGKRYLVAAIVQRPHNDANAEELIRQISGTAYRFFDGNPLPSRQNRRRGDGETGRCSRRSVSRTTKKSSYFR